MFFWGEKKSWLKKMQKKSVVHRISLVILVFFDRFFKVLG